MNQKILTTIKIVSSILISIAIGLELWNLTVKFTHLQLPHLPSLLFIFSRFILTAHAIEAAISAIYAPTKNQKVLRFSIYTFFVGTVGLLELFELLPTDPPPTSN